LFCVPSSNDSINACPIIPARDLCETLPPSCAIFPAPPIVAIQENDHLAATLRNSRVERRRLPAILFCKQTNLRLIVPQQLLRCDPSSRRLRQLLRASDAGKSCSSTLLIAVWINRLMVVCIDEDAELHVRETPGLKARPHGLSPICEPGNTNTDRQSCAILHMEVRQALEENKPHVIALSFLFRSS